MAVEKRTGNRTHQKAREHSEECRHARQRRRAIESQREQHDRDADHRLPDAGNLHPEQKPCNRRQGQHRPIRHIDGDVVLLGSARHASTVSARMVGAERSVRTGENTSQSVESTAPKEPRKSVVRTPAVSPKRPPRSEPASVAPSPRNRALAVTRPSTRTGASACRKLTWLI